LDVSWITVVATLVLGFASGVLSGMFGVGGAVVTTPGIRALGASPIEAVGSTVPAIFPGAISGTYRYSKAGLVNWRIGLTCGSVGAATAALGAVASDHVNGHLLMVFTASLLLVSGASIFRSGLARPDEEALLADPLPADDVEIDLDVITDPPTHTAAPLAYLAVIGAAAGLLAGFLGVGGGVVMVPAFTAVLKVPIKEAVASSLVAVAIFSIPALASHALLGHINWAFAFLLTLGVVPGAQLGSRVTLGTSDHVVRRMFGGFLVVVALIYGIGEILAI
jgi:uncharacterized protein